MADHTEGGTEAGLAGIIFASALSFAHQGLSFSATAYIRRALGVFEKVMGENHRYRLSTRNTLTHSYLSVRDRAVPLVERALRNSWLLPENDHPVAAKVRMKLAAVADPNAQQG
ncbi:hypothetical protein [Streptomyces sp. NPDC021096]|uniref:hypothetical protein n=1 Tax=Streptomyces sp. NPDC021096 TaxID=3154792 RepID=UPI0033FBC319